MVEKLLTLFWVDSRNCKYIPSQVNNVLSPNLTFPVFFFSYVLLFNFLFFASWCWTCHPFSFEGTLWFDMLVRFFFFDLGSLIMLCCFVDVILWNWCIDKLCSQIVDVLTNLLVRILITKERWACIGFCNYYKLFSSC